MDRKANAIVPTQPTYFYLDCLYQTVTSTNRQLSKQHASEYSDRYESISTQFAETSVISRPISDRRTGQCVWISAQKRSSSFKTRYSWPRYTNLPFYLGIIMPLFRSMIKPNHRLLLTFCLGYVKRSFAFSEVLNLITRSLSHPIHSMDVESRLLTPAL